jgi:hypothetical protein
MTQILWMMDKESYTLKSSQIREQRVHETEATTSGSVAAQQKFKRDYIDTDGNKKQNSVARSPRANYTD